MRTKYEELERLNSMGLIKREQGTWGLCICRLKKIDFPGLAGEMDIHLSSRRVLGLL